MARQIAILLMVGLCCSVFSRPATAADVKRGQEISQLHCARCHVVGDFNPMGGISSTPSFYLLVREFKDWRKRFETFFVRRPHPAFLSVKGIGRLHQKLPPNAHPVELPEDAINDIVAYAGTLRKLRVDKKIPITKRLNSWPR